MRSRRIKEDCLPAAAFLQAFASHPYAAVPASHHKDALFVERTTQTLLRGNVTTLAHFRSSFTATLHEYTAFSMSSCLSNRSSSLSVSATAWRCQNFSPRGSQISVNFYNYHSIVTTYQYTDTQVWLLASCILFQSSHSCTACLLDFPQLRLLLGDIPAQSDGWSRSQFTWQFGGYPFDNPQWDENSSSQPPGCC